MFVIITDFKTLMGKYYTYVKMAVIKNTNY